MERELLAGVLLAVVVLASLVFRRRTAKGPERVDPGQLGLTGTGHRLVLFTSPYCIPCRQWREQLAEASLDATFVEVKSRPDLARDYHVRTTPLVLLVRMPSGRVENAWVGEPPPGEVERLRAVLGTAVPA